MEQDNNIANEPIESVEKEDVGASKITDPYNPEEIKIDQKNLNLGFIIEMLENEEIDLMPDFQRNMDLWDDTKKSRLIESLLLGLPIPSFYFSEEANRDKQLVVDGLQRLCAFQDFIVDKKLKLSNLQFLESYKDKFYEDLSREDKRKISGTQLNCYVIQK
ncbi:MAG: DUF262 domain-containing protein, partial [Deltaproteobacteria bacterium]|nr:DUF262 domain-containing protein [Deltaproteobacteria bacterium]